MKHLVYFSLLLLGAGSFSSCKKNQPSVATGTGLEGSWKLTDRQCFCPPGSPVPNETVTFTATTYSFRLNGTLTTAGNYQPATAALCGGATPVSVLQFGPTYPSSSVVRLSAARATFALTGNTLVLDYGIACDAPRDTYQRLP